MPKRFSFSGGVSLSSNKELTGQLPIEAFPAPAKVFIPLLQHNGSAVQATVKPGDYVKIGQLIGDSTEHGSLPVHSSVSGNVQSIGLYPHPSGKHISAVEIENDGNESKIDFEPFDKPWREAAPEELIRKIQSCGITGMGSGIPTYLKLTSANNKSVSTLIINAIESEPYISADQRIIIEKTEEFLNGILILKKITGATSAIIAVNENMPSTTRALSSWLSDSRYKEISTASLKPKYPQGSERQLISALTKKQIPSGGTSVDVSCIVFNVATAQAVHDAIIDGIPVYQRVVSICGTSLGTPKNLLVRIGTPFKEILDRCEMDAKTTQKVIMGGPMMGIAQTDLTSPVIKTTNGLFVYDKVTPALRVSPCINCGNCVKVCPVKLVPARITKYVEHDKLSQAIDWNIMDCIECGSCAYVCPSKINIVHFIRLGKYNVQKNKMFELASSKENPKGSI